MRNISPYGLIHKSVHDAFAWCSCFSLILFCSPHSEGEMYSEELRNIVKCGIAASIVGMVYGGLPGARHARERFIQLSQAEMYQNRVDAVVRHRTEAANVFFLFVAETCFVHLFIQISALISPFFLSLNCFVLHFL